MFKGVKENDVVINVNGDAGDGIAAVWLVAPQKPGSKTLGYIF